MYIDVTRGDKAWRELYKLCISFINPRPIALVSSVSTDGRPNLAPFSFYNMVCGNPPVVMFSPGIHRDGRPKDTLTNVKQTGEFVVATVTADIGPQMVRCASELPYGVSEWEFSGLTPSPAAIVRPPLVKESPINVECTVRQILPIGEGPGSVQVVFGDIRAVHVADALLTPDGAVDPHKLHTVGRLGGAWYANVAAPYEMHVPPPPT